jgi:hypothetical protein
MNHNRAMELFSFLETVLRVRDKSEISGLLRFPFQAGKIAEYQTVTLQFGCEINIFLASIWAY